STWWDIAFISLVVIPACFGLVWLLLPLQRGRGLLAAGVGFGVLAWAFHVAGWNTAENFCKLFGITFVGFAFLAYFEALSWVVLSFGATLALAVWRNLDGLPALPLLALGFLLANGDLIWTQLRHGADARR